MLKISNRITIPAHEIEQQAHLWGILWFRLVFAFVFTCAVSYWLTKMSPEFQQKYLLRP